MIKDNGPESYEIITYITRVIQIEITLRYHDMRYYIICNLGKNKKL